MRQSSQNGNFITSDKIGTHNGIIAKHIRVEEFGHFFGIEITSCAHHRELENTDDYRGYHIIIIAFNLDIHQ